VTGGLIAQALQCAHALRLHHDRSFQQCFSRPDDKSIFNRAYWYLYSAEKSFCLVNGTLSMIDDESIDYEPLVPSAYSHDPHSLDWLSVQVSYGKVCSAILKKFYHPRAALRSLEDLERNMSQFHSLLNSWKESLPPQFQSFVSDEHPPSSSEIGEESHIELQLFYQYHQALFAIHAPIVRLQFSYEHTEGFRDFKASSEQTCIDSARAILLAGSHIRISDVLLDW